ncbi:MAG: hypothetical protein Q4D26_10590 [Clostridia bacterium]|nr:hypothetical protein [Clostridia bacterium]
MNIIKKLVLFLTLIFTITIISGCSDEKLKTDNEIIANINSAYEYLTKAEDVYNSFCANEINQEKAQNSLEEYETLINELENNTKKFADNDIEEISNYETFSELSKYVLSASGDIGYIDIMCQDYIDVVKADSERNRKFAEKSKKNFLNNMNLCSEDTNNNRQDYLKSLGYTDTEIEKIMSENDFKIN